MSNKLIYGGIIFLVVKCSSTVYAVKTDFFLATSDVYTELINNGAKQKKYYLKLADSNVTVDILNGLPREIFIQKQVKSRKVSLWYFRLNKKFHLKKVRFSQNSTLHSSDEMVSLVSDSIRGDCGKTFLNQFQNISLRSLVDGSCEEQVGNFADSVMEALDTTLDEIYKSESFFDRFSQFKFADVSEVCRDDITTSQEKLGLILTSDLTIKSPKIVCKINKEFQKPCISGSIQKGENELIEISISSSCSREEIAANLPHVLRHEYAHRVVPGREDGRASSQQIESIIDAIVGNPRNIAENIQAACSATEKHFYIPGAAQSQLVATNVAQAEPPAKLRELSASAVPANLADSLDHDAKFGSASSRPTAFSANYRTIPSTVASAGRAAAIGNLAENVTRAWMDFAKGLPEGVTYSWQNPKFPEPSEEGLKLPLADAKGDSGTRNPASLSGSSNPGSDSQSNSSGPAVGRASAARYIASAKASPEQKASEKADEILKKEGIAVENKPLLEKALAQIYRAKNSTELRTFLIQQGMVLNKLKIHVADPRSQEKKFYGYDDSKTAKVVFSITKEGQLIDETQGSDETQ